jgi:hypothetical protein
MKGLWVEARAFAVSFSFHCKGEGEFCFPDGFGREPCEGVLVVLGTASWFMKGPWVGASGVSFSFHCEGEGVGEFFLPAAFGRGPCNGFFGVFGRVSWFMKGPIVGAPETSASVVSFSFHREGEGEGELCLAAALGRELCDGLLVVLGNGSWFMQGLEDGARATSSAPVVSFSLHCEGEGEFRLAAALGRELCDGFLAVLGTASWFMKGLRVGSRETRTPAFKDATGISTSTGTGEAEKGQGKEGEAGT